MDTFTLFAERPFNAYAHERLSAIARSINDMSDVEVLMYKTDFETLLKRLVKTYSLKPVNISFDDKLVDLIAKPYRDHDRYFAEYTLQVSGEGELLKLCPYEKPVHLRIPVALKTNVLIFEIDTHYYNANLTEGVMDNIKVVYDTVKDFITNTLLCLNNESQKFNLQLEQFIIPILANKLRTAQRHTEIKQLLNFK